LGAQELAAKGIFININGYGLNGQGCMLEQMDGEIITKEISHPEIAFGGLHVKLAENLDAAAAIGKQCPTFSIGDKIEARELI